MNWPLRFLYCGAPRPFMTLHTRDVIVRSTIFRIALGREAREVIVPSRLVPAAVLVYLVLYLAAPLPLSAQFECHPSGRQWNNIDFFHRCLQEYGLDAWPTEEGRSTILHDIAHRTDNPNIVDLLLKAGANPNATDDNGYTPLGRSAFNTNPMVTSHLLRAGADPNAPNIHGQTPLHDAVEHNNLPVIQLLVRSGANPTAVSHDGWTPFHSAVFLGHRSVARGMIEAGAGARLTPLHRAVLYEDVAVVASFLANSADPDASDGHGWNALHFAATLADSAILAHVLQSSSDPNAKTTLGMSPLHLAADSSTISSLLEAGVDIETQDAAGRTPLHQISEFRDAGAIKALLNAPADVYASDADGNCPYDLTSRNLQLANHEVLRQLYVPGPMRCKTWSAWDLYWENDTFVPSDYASDERYTNGIRVTLTRNPNGKWNWPDHVMNSLAKLRFLDRGQYASSGGVVMGQHFYTPHDITSFSKSPRDRPYAGFLYGGVYAEITEKLDTPAAAYSEPRVSVLRQHSLELNLGLLGPSALAGRVQKHVHVLRLSRIPKGWRHQLRNELAVQAVYRARASLLRQFWSSIIPQFEIVPQIGLGLGTVQTFGSLGAILRFGTASSLPIHLIPGTRFVPHVGSLPRPTQSSTPRLWFEWTLMAGVEYRAFLRNAYVDGNLFLDDFDIEPDHFIREWRLGAMARLNRLIINYSFVNRDSEYLPGKGDGRHNFGSLAIALELARPQNAVQVEGIRNDFQEWLKRDISVEIIVGNGWSQGNMLFDVEPELTSGASMRASASKGIINWLVGDWLVGFELSGVVREGEPPDAVGCHQDTFIRTKAGTIGLRPSGLPESLIIRAGLGRGKVRKEHNCGDEQPARHADEKGWGGLFGISYGMPLGDHVSMAVDATVGYIWSLSSNSSRTTTFLSLGIGLRYHPEF